MTRSEPLFLILWVYALLCINELVRVTAHSRHHTFPALHARDIGGACGLLSRMQLNEYCLLHMKVCVKVGFAVMLGRL